MNFQNVEHIKSVDKMTLENSRNCTCSIR